MSTPKFVSKSGGTRSSKVTRYDLIPHEGLRRLGARYELGAGIHGESNWKRALGDKDFIDQAKCHLIEHLWDYLENGCEKDDNLAAVAWGAFCLMEAERVAREEKDDTDDAVKRVLEAAK